MTYQGKNEMSARAGVALNPRWAPLHVLVAALASLSATPGCSSADACDADEVPVLRVIAPRVGEGEGDDDMARYTAADGIFAASAETLSVDWSPTSMATADLNGDRAPDLVAAERDTDSVAVLLQTAPRAFGKPNRFDVGTSPSSVAVGDFDENGHADLAVSNALSDDVSVLLGDGRGGFAAATSVPCGRLPVFVAVADLDADGHHDLIVANKGSGNVSILFGDGLGSFGAQRVLPSGIGPVAVAVGDFDTDDDVDLVVVDHSSPDALTPSNTVTVFLGEGGRGFSEDARYQVGDFPRSVAVADLNADGDLDLAIQESGSSTSGRVNVLLGDGAANFREATSSVETWTRAPIVATGDLDLDGAEDVVLAGSDSLVTILIGDGTGALVGPSMYVFGELTAGALADLDRDGDLDLAVADFWSLIVWENVVTR